MPQNLKEIVETTSPCTGYERNGGHCPDESNTIIFSNYPEHNPIDIPDNNPDFRCSDDVTMISGSARGMLNSDASSKVLFLSGHPIPGHGKLE